ncbi:MAG: dephospho-CoA kinase [Tepidanaerobacter acetatoxydans]|uniref:dephospho-CoA kinase n=1 Tax=Tepidanaerobacter acetatoxydans TaxID=499229 RepID=UPI00350E5760|nr:dephospho-CoA kinase [Tepidanaerobacter acetatoxydans]
MTVVGLTGGIASGKSTVSSLLKDKGAAIIDADEIAKEIMSKGKPVWVNVVNHFGEQILNDDKSDIDRKKLADIVFSDRVKLEALNSLTHPEILKEIKKQLENYKKAGRKVIVIDAALLLESGLDTFVDEVWLVVVDEKTQLERLVMREKDMDFAQALNRIKSQMPLKEKLKYANRVIDNNSSIEETREQIDEIWREIS